MCKPMDCGVAGREQPHPTGKWPPVSPSVGDSCVKSLWGLSFYHSTALQDPLEIVCIWQCLIHSTHKTCSMGKWQNASQSSSLTPWLLKGTTSRCSSVAGSGHEHTVLLWLCTASHSSSCEPDCRVWCLHQDAQTYSPPHSPYVMLPAWQTGSVLTVSHYSLSRFPGKIFPSIPQRLWR